MIEYNINTEDASDHWKYFNPYKKIVLDLGCGRACSREGSYENLVYEEFSPIWLGLKGAQKVIGVDISAKEIEFFNQSIQTTQESAKYIFLQKEINSYNIIKELITTYTVDSIKCDIEGAEVNFYNFTKSDLVNIKNIAIEYHSHDIKNNFIKKIKEWGFTIIAHGKLWVDGMGVLFAEK